MDASSTSMYWSTIWPKQRLRMCRKHIMCWSIGSNLIPHLASRSDNSHMAALLFLALSRVKWPICWELANYECTHWYDAHVVCTLCVTSAWSNRCKIVFAMFDLVWRPGKWWKVRSPAFSLRVPGWSPLVAQCAVSASKGQRFLSVQMSLMNEMLPSAFCQKGVNKTDAICSQITHSQIIL